MQRRRSCATRCARRSSRSRQKPGDEGSERLVLYRKKLRSGERRLSASNPRRKFRHGRRARLPPRLPPPRRPGLGLGTEPALALRGIDPSLVVRLTTRSMVDPHSLAADVPLDPATAARTLPGLGGRALDPLTLPPPPRRHEVATPQPPFRSSCRPLVGYIVHRVVPVRERPSLAHHPPIEVLAPDATHGHDSPVTVPVALLAGNRPPTDTPRKRTGRLGPASPAAAAGDAGLLRLWRVDAVQTNALAGHPNRIPIRHRGAAVELRMCGRQPGDNHQGKNGGDNSEQDLGLPGLNSRVRAMRPPRVPYSRAENR